MECAKDYQAIIAEDGKLAFIIPARKNEPGDTKIVYNGGTSALLYRSHSDIIVLDNLHPEAQTALKTAYNVVVIEADMQTNLTIYDYACLVYHH